MLKLRRWMTEILLDVTTDMMEEVCGEVLNRARMKGIKVPEPCLWLGKYYSIFNKATVTLHLKSIYIPFC